MAVFLCFGAGYTGQYLFPRARSLFNDIRVAARGYCSHMTPWIDQEDTWLKRVCFDGSVPLDEGAFDGVTHILSLIPPVDGKDIVLSRHLSVFRKIKTLVWIGYISTTGVYGDARGGWVDEDKPVCPVSKSSVIRAHIENEWRSLYTLHGLPVHIFRVAGIYGPGRSALDRLLQGNAQVIVKPGHVFSRVHVDDLARAILASMEFPFPGSIYNVADDWPSSTTDYFKCAAQLLNMEMPSGIPFEVASISPRLREFYEECRRVSNLRLKTGLGFSFLYPTCKEGLASMLPQAEKP